MILSGLLKYVLAYPQIQNTNLKKKKKTDKLQDECLLSRLNCHAFPSNILRIPNPQTMFLHMGVQISFIVLSSHLDKSLFIYFFIISIYFYKSLFSSPISDLSLIISNLFCLCCSKFVT